VQEDREHRIRMEDSIAANSVATSAASSLATWLNPHSRITSLTKWRAARGDLTSAGNRAKTLPSNSALPPRTSGLVGASLAVIPLPGYSPSHAPFNYHARAIPIHFETGSSQ
jgi:hypothetical protein